ncbi:hypothetical protein GN956_G17828 [Arapaima gigas]
MDLHFSACGVQACSEHGPCCRHLTSAVTLVVQGFQKITGWNSLVPAAELRVLVEGDCFHHVLLSEASAYHLSTTSWVPHDLAELVITQSSWPEVSRCSSSPVPDEKDRCV